jgi:hypothetical protein
VQSAGDRESGFGMLCFGGASSQLGHVAVAAIDVSFQMLMRCAVVSRTHVAARFSRAPLVPAHRSSISIWTAACRGRRVMSPVQVQGTADVGGTARRHAASWEPSEHGDFHL